MNYQEGQTETLAYAKRGARKRNSRIKTFFFLNLFYPRFKILYIFTVTWKRYKTADKSPTIMILVQLVQKTVNLKY